MVSFFPVQIGRIRSSLCTVLLHRDLHLVNEMNNLGQQFGPERQLEEETEPSHEDSKCLKQI